MHSVLSRRILALAVLALLSARSDADEAAALKAFKSLGAKQALGVGINLQKSRITDVDMPWFAECKGLIGVSLADTAITDVGLRELARCKNLREIHLSGCKISDAGLVAAVSGLKDLNDLNVDRTPITGAVFRELKHLKKMQFLWMQKTQITDAALKDIRQFPELEILDLRFTRIGDEGISSLRGLKNLRSLLLDGTDITDDTLRMLQDTKSFEQLRVVDLYKTRVSAAAIAEMKKARGKGLFLVAH